MSIHSIELDPRQIRRRKQFNTFFSAMIMTLAVLSVIPLFLILTHIVKEGFASLKPEFFTSLPKPVGETGGGIANALVGTFMLIGIATILALPVGIGAGLFLAEHPKSKIGELVRLSVEVLQGIPSIVIGLIVYMICVKPIGNFSALSGGIALAIMMLPFIVRTTEETLRLIPTTLKEASLALGAPYYHTILQVILPAGLNGIITGVLVSIARIAGETAPLLFTAFGNPYMNANPLKPIASLPHLIFTYAISPYDDWHALAWGAAIILLGFILMLNFGARMIASKFGMDHSA